MQSHHIHPIYNCNLAKNYPHRLKTISTLSTAIFVLSLSIPATLLTLCPIFGLPQLHSPLRPHHLRVHLHHLFPDLHYRFMNVLSRLCTHLPKLYSILLQKCHVPFWHLLFCIVAFIYKTKYVLVVVRILLCLFYPKLLQVLESLYVVYVAYQNHCIGSFVVRLGNPPEPFLPSRIPDLQLHILLANVQRPT